MTTSRANLLAGVDMEGGEGFCDNIYNFLKNQGKDINLFTNSGFGVWSQSDANKGLAALVFDNGTVAPVVGETIVGANATGKIIWVDVTNDDWAGGNGAGTAYLGAVTGAYEDGETIAGSVVAAFDVNGDKSIGRTNDPMNNDDTADWATTDCNLAFAAAEYTITRTAASQIISKTCSLEEGHIYKIEIDIKDGTEAGVDVLGYSNNVGGAVIYPYFTTAAGWASVSWTFESTATDAAAIVGIAAYILVGGQTIEVRRFSVYEIDPCCTAGDALAYDGASKDATLDIYREYYGSNTKGGSFYALKMVVTAANDYVFFPPAAINALSEFYETYKGRPITFGAWVKTSTADHARLRIQDSDGNSDSSLHSGGGDWEWLEVTREVGNTITTLRFMIHGVQAPNVDGTTIIYISQKMGVFGWSLGEGMYQPRLQEVIFLDAYISSNRLDALLLQSTQGPIDMNLEADSDAKLPKGAKAFIFTTKVRDTGSSAAIECRLWTRPHAGGGAIFYAASGGLFNSAYGYGAGNCGCDPTGDFQWGITASGANTLDVGFFHYVAVQVN